jgi:hypothetical protein
VLVLNPPAPAVVVAPLPALVVDGEDPATAGVVATAPPAATQVPSIPQPYPDGQPKVPQQM